jgi:hypothetical protein
VAREGGEASGKAVEGARRLMRNQEELAKQKAIEGKRAVAQTQNPATQLLNEYSHDLVHLVLCFECLFTSMDPLTHIPRLLAYSRYRD